MKLSIAKRVALIGLLGAASSLFGETVWLSSLDLKRMTTGWSVANADRGVGGQALSIGGKQFAHGVGTHASSVFRVNLGGQASRFVARVGVDDSAGSHGSVEFIVTGDRRVLCTSGVMTGGQQAIPVDVDLSGVQTLVLRVTDGGDGSGLDHADWAEARIVMKNGAPPPMALPPYEALSLRTAHFTLDFRVGDDGRLYQRAIGSAEANEKLERFDEAYPQAGDGYIPEGQSISPFERGNPAIANLDPDLRSAMQNAALKARLMRPGRSSPSTNGRVRTVCVNRAVLSLDATYRKT